MPATEVTSVAAGAPARVFTTPPTFLHPSLRRLADSSRPPTPRGSLLPFGWGNVPTPIRPITDRPSLSPRSFPRSPIGCACAPPTPRGGLRAYHVPQVERTGGLGRVSSPVVRHLRAVSSEHRNLTTCLLAQASFASRSEAGTTLAVLTQHLWLVLCDDVSRRFTWVDLATPS